MVSTALLSEFTTGVDSVATVATRDVVRLWRGLEWADASVSTDALLASVGDITTAWGEIAANLAMDFYDEARADARAAGVFRAEAARPAVLEQVQAVVRWAVGPMWSSSPRPTVALTNLVGGVERLVRQPSRATVIDNVRRDRAAQGYARRTRTGACPFCLMLASRGAVYKEDSFTRSSARFVGAGEVKVHNHCKCRPTPVWSPDDVPAENRDLEQQWGDVTRGLSGKAARHAWAQHIAASRG